MDIVFAGSKIHNWTILETKIKKQGKTLNYARCQCSCSSIHLVTETALRNNRSHSCKACADKARGLKFIKIGKYLPSAYLGIVRGNATRRNLEFNLTLDYLDKLYEAQNFKCALSGVSIKMPMLMKSHIIGNKFDVKGCTASLDRIDSTKGYIEGNVQWVHKSINMMKNSLDDLSFISLCKLVSDYNFNKELLPIEEIYSLTKYGRTIR